jgi:dTDP-4-dehydrorhamnose reductase
MVAGGTPISWFAFAKLIFESAGLKPELQSTNEREYRTCGKRPKYSALSNAKMESEGVAPFPPLAIAVKSYLKIRQSMV